MALSTRTISNSIDWAKRLSFNRNPVIGNSLEPALTSANIVTQVILSPPFDWWWNNQELVFTCNPTPNTATITNVAILNGVLTITAANTFAAGNLIRLTGITTATQLNGLIFTVASATGATITANTTLANYGPAADTGTVTNMTTQDYTVSAPAFSHIEHASVLDLDTSNNPVKWWELTVRNELALESSQNRPQFVSPHVEDGNGNVTFRVNPAPDKAYPISVHVQLAAPQITSINQPWGLPDFMQYIYDWGFLSLMWHFADDPRAAYANEKFVSGILARAEGLTEEERNIFLANWNNITNAPAMNTQMGVMARGK